MVTRLIHEKAVSRWPGSISRRPEAASTSSPARRKWRIWPPRHRPPGQIQPAVRWTATTATPWSAAAALTPELAPGLRSLANLPLTSWPHEVGWHRHPGHGLRCPGGGKRRMLADLADNVSPSPWKPLCHRRRGAQIRRGKRAVGGLFETVPEGIVITDATNPHPRSNKAFTAVAIPQKKPSARTQAF